MMYASIKSIWYNYNFIYRPLSSCSLKLVFLKLLLTFFSPTLSIVNFPVCQHCSRVHGRTLGLLPLQSSAA